MPGPNVFLFLEDVQRNRKVTVGIDGGEAAKKSVFWDGEIGTSLSLAITAQRGQNLSPACKVGI